MKRTFSIILSFLVLVSGLWFLQCTAPVTPKSSAKNLSFLVLDDIQGSLGNNVTFNAVTSTYSFNAPNGTNVSAIKLFFQLSNGATANPASGSTQNFTNPVTYTVTAEDGSTQVYKVEVVFPPRTSFTFVNPLIEIDANILRNPDRTFIRYDKYSGINFQIEPNRDGAPLVRGSQASGTEVPCIVKTNFPEGFAFRLNASSPDINQRIIAQNISGVTAKFVLYRADGKKIVSDYASSLNLKYEGDTIKIFVEPNKEIYILAFDNFITNKLYVGLKMPETGLFINSKK